MTPRVSLLEKHHLRLITAEPVSWHLQPSMWPAELKYWPFWKRFGQEWWEAAPVAEPPEMLCSSFAALSSLRAHGAFTMRRGGLAELLSFPRQLCLPASAPSVLGHSGKELCSPNCTWTQEWNWGLFSCCYQSFANRWYFRVCSCLWVVQRCDSAHLLLLFGHVFITGCYFCTDHPFFWWLQEVKCSFNLQA